MSQLEINQGEIKFTFSQPVSGRLSFTDLGIKKEDVSLESGLLRLVLELNHLEESHYFKMPTVEVVYEENMDATHWQCEFNEETILDKIDNHGHSTILLIDRKKLSELEHRHENVLIVHAEFPQSVNIDPDKSFIQLFN